MASVAEHYESVLSPVYAWMAGGAEAALAAGKAEIDELLRCRRARWSSISGAGFGMHADPAGAYGRARDRGRQLGAVVNRADRLAGDLPDQDRARRPVVVPFARQGKTAASFFAWGTRSRTCPSTPTSISWCRRSSNRWRPAAASCFVSRLQRATDRREALHSRAQRRAPHPHLFPRIRGRHRGRARHPARARGDAWETKSAAIANCGSRRSG